MLTPDPTTKRGAARTAGFVLLALITLALGVEGGPPLHTHEASTASVYNGECPLAVLAAFHGASALPDSPSATGFVVAGGVPVATLTERRPASPVPHTDSRAPPAPLG